VPYLDSNIIAIGDFASVHTLSVSGQTLNMTAILNSTRSGVPWTPAASPSYLYIEGTPARLLTAGAAATLSAGGSQRTDPNIIDLDSDLASLTSLSVSGNTLTLVGTLLASRSYNASPKYLYVQGSAQRAVPLT
jgi:hypothetical protein